MLNRDTGGGGYRTLAGVAVVGGGGGCMTSVRPHTYEVYLPCVSCVNACILLVLVM